MTTYYAKTSTMTVVAKIVVASLPGKPAKLAKERYCVTRDGKVVRGDQCSVRVWIWVSKP